MRKKKKKKTLGGEYKVFGGVGEKEDDLQKN